MGWSKEAAKDSRGIYSCLSKVDIEFAKATKLKMRRGLRFYNIHCRQIASLAKFTRNDEKSKKWKDKIWKILKTGIKMLKNGI